MDASATNPLLEKQFAIPFDRIRAEHVEPATKILLDTARAAVKAVADLDAPRTYDNTMDALERATETLEWAVGIVGHLESVATTPALRAAYNAIVPEVSLFYSSLPLDADLWRAIRAYADTDDARSLAGARKRFLTKTVDDFRRHGAELDADGKKRLLEIDVELAKITTTYAENVLDATAAFELVVDDEALLAGLPESAIDAARESAREAGKDGWRFTLQEPSFVAVMTYLDDAGIRERMYRARSTRATEEGRDNRPLVARILELRREKAALLGYGSYADLVLEDRMAHDGARARAFVDSLREKAEAAFAHENAELEAFRHELEGAGAPPLQPWDLAYYAEKQRKALYDFDEEALRPYFPADRVIEGMFEVVQRLYGVRIEPRDDLPTWDDAVRCYRIAEGDRTLGSFYADLHPRETKRDGAWMNGLITATGDDPHLGLIVGNVNPPVGGKPALLTHREVETLFHEFGHLMHHCLSRVPVRSLGGTNVAWDFVELPSQIMENWTWEREALDLFARHYESGEPIPDELFRNMRRARTYRAAYSMMRQLGFATLDLALHVDYDPERDGNPVAHARAIVQQHSPAPLPADHALVASFGHLFADPVGYAAGYYSYKWAEVLDADAFTRFHDEGIFSAAAGRAFREQILARGDGDDPAVLYRGFMGRDPKLEPLLERFGLLAASA